jgi:RNA polymerase sigma-70 factor (ECF subfamily)
MDETTSPNWSFNDAALAQIDALFGYAMTLTRDRTAAEDLVQETYLRAARAANRLSADDNLRNWMFVIMRNAWLNQVRREKTGPRFVDFADEDPTIDDWQADADSNPQVVYLRKLERDEVRRAIESLPATYREIVLLRDIEGFSYQEIATVLGCPAGTVMSRLGRAREKLRQHLKVGKPRARQKLSN